MATVVILVRKRVKYIEVIRASIKVCTKLGNSVMLIFTDFGNVYGSNNVSYETNLRWRKNFLTGTKLVKDATNLADM